MSLTLTHAFVPISAAIAIARRPVAWRLLAAAVLVSMAPDLDGLSHPLFGIARDSIYGHRGAAHSLFTALAVGCVAAFCHRALRVRALTAGVAVALAMASHGLIDMMTNSGKPVAYLWPISSIRLFADWRPLPGSGAYASQLWPQIVGRIGPEMVHIVLPLVLAGTAFRVLRATLSRR